MTTGWRRKKASLEAKEGVVGSERRRRWRRKKASSIPSHPGDPKTLTMADVEADVPVAGQQPKKRTFKKFSFRGVDLDALLDMSTDELVKLFTARARRRFRRGLTRKPMALIKKLRKAKREAPPGEKPEPVRTHLRNMIIVPEMIGSIIGVYNGKTFNQVEIKPEMIGHYLAEFSISYKPVKHGRPGIGATHSSRFIPLK
ncbi:40S ribosomal protein S15-4 [Cucumis melo var. makuwa]|uniref:40S ribosomal protein S15-4 n=1 Tax=Cucumis melo var. makuwa TaxID=1194695 RepID=A0A5A7UQZ4_CUCMM|nr:40S ribosomal protein S15-4 [Cucumis melo var. makuwa]